MRFSDLEIQKLAQLAKLRLNESEAKSLAGDLDHILDYVAQLKAAPTEDDKEKRDPSSASGRTQDDGRRADRISPSEPETVLALLANVPNSERGFVKFKKIHKHE